MTFGSLGQRFESLDLHSIFSLFVLGSVEAVIIPNYAEVGNCLGVLTILVSFHMLIII